MHILFADGEVWALSPDTPIDALKPFLTITAAKTADRDKQLAPYRVDWVDSVSTSPNPSCALPRLPGRAQGNASGATGVPPPNLSALLAGDKIVCVPKPRC